MRMGYNMDHVIQGQVFIISGLLLSLFHMFILTPLSSFFPIPVSVLFLIGGAGYFLAAGGGVLAVIGALFGGETDPYNLFWFGLLMVAEGVGLMVAGLILHWSPIVSPWWMGGGPKPEAALFLFYASVQIATGVVVTLLSLPSIFGEMAQLARE